jgi:hypothetical protein
MPGNIIFSQYYVEQNSGVTTSLTSVCVNQSISYYGNVWICGYSGVVLKTTNEGTNWINVSGNGIPSSVDLVNIYCFDAGSAVTAGYTGSGAFVYRTSNGGANWQQVFSQPNGFIDAIWMKNSLEGFMYGDPVGYRWSLWKTSNGGINWDSSGMFLPQSGTEAGWNNALYIHNTRIYFGTNNHRIYFSSNFGSSWLAGTIFEANSYALWFYYADSLYGYYGGSNSYKTTNGGVSWILMNCPGSGNFAGFVSGNALSPNAPYPPSISWTIRGDNKIYQNYNMLDWMTAYTAPGGNYYHIGTDYNYPLLYTWAVRSNGGITRIVTLYGEVKKISSAVPNNFSLFQNSPNPFNPKSKIKFQIAVLGKVKLLIFDALGKEITELVNKQLQPGIYEAEWDGTNYPSGVYFYKLITAEYTETRKMVLVK